MPPTPPVPPVPPHERIVESTGSMPERLGPLVVRRFIKEDGRNLLLYGRVPDDEPAT
jgi:hypothetical protein